MLIRKVSFKTVAFSSPEKLKKTKRDIFLDTLYIDFAITKPLIFLNEGMDVDGKIWF